MRLSSLIFGVFGGILAARGYGAVLYSVNRYYVLYILSMPLDVSLCKLLYTQFSKLHRGSDSYIEVFYGYYMSTITVFTPVDNNRVQQNRDFDW